MSFDWEPFKGGTGAFAKFDALGDECVGEIVAIRTHTFDKEKGEVVLLDIAPKEGGEHVTLACDKVDLRIKLADLAPQVSDMLAVKFVATEKTPNGTKKVFAVRHKEGARPAVSSFDEPVEFDDGPF